VNGSPGLSTRAARLGRAVLALATAAACASGADRRAAAAEAPTAPLVPTAAFEPLVGVGASERGSDARGAWLRFETAGPGVMAAVGTASPLIPPIDLHGRFVSLQVRVDAAERLAGAELLLASRDGSFAIDVPIFDDATMNLLQSGQWVDLTLGLGAARRAGRPDRGAIERVEWRVSEREGAGPRLTGWVAGLGAHALPREGVVSFTFDDGYDEHYDAAAPILAESGLRGTAYVMPDQVGQPGYMTQEQLHALDADFGWDVASHHFTPFTEFPRAELPGVLDGILGSLSASGFERGVRHLAYPLGKHDAEIVARVRPRFATARLASGGAETLPPADPYRLRALNVLRSTPPSALVAAAERARDEREWLILMFHYLVEEPAIDTEYAVRDLRAAAAGVAATGVAVRPVSEVWRALESDAVAALRARSSPRARRAGDGAALSQAR
jgi:peptidoglycan/xylan/chitin deacetylase (PgdA/CDA1 family)